MSTKIAANFVAVKIQQCYNKKDIEMEVVKHGNEKTMLEMQ